MIKGQESIEVCGLSDSHNLRIWVRSDVYVNTGWPVSVCSSVLRLGQKIKQNRGERLWGYNSELRKYYLQLHTIDVRIYRNVIRIFVDIGSIDSRYLDIGYQGCLWPPPVFVMTTNISLLLTRASLTSGRFYISFTQWIIQHARTTIDTILFYFSLNQRSDNVTWGKLRLRSAQNKEREKTLRLSNKYDFKHLNYSEERSEFFTEETIKALENGSASDQARNFVTKETEQNMQDFQQQVEIRQMETTESDGELEELNKTVRKYVVFLVFSSVTEYYF